MSTYYAIVSAPIVAVVAVADDFTRDRVGHMVEPSPLRENSFSDDD